MLSTSLICSWHCGLDVANVLRNNSIFASDVIYSCVGTEVTDVQMHNVDLMFEFVLIRNGLAVLPCWFLKSDVLMIVDYICTV